MSNYRIQRYMRENLQRRTANDVNDAKKMENFDPKNAENYIMKQRGKLFFEEGNFLDEAPEELKKNVFFVEGYEKASKRKKELYDLGVQYFIDGIDYEKISEIYQNNNDFMQGYNDAFNQSLIDGIDWTLFPDKNDIEMYKEGKKWFCSGVSIELAPEDRKYNTYFINGFNVEKEAEENKMNSYDLGMQKFIEGVEFFDNSRENQRNKYFVQGYMDARDQSLMDGVDWEDVSDKLKADKHSNQQGKSRR